MRETANRERQAAWSQFMTPPEIARFMVSLFSANSIKNCSLLDAGAGLGALSFAFLNRWEEGSFNFTHLDAHAYEIDPLLRPRLTSGLKRHSKRLPMAFQVIDGDFIEHAAMLREQRFAGFTHAVLNPPYKKLRSHSGHRAILRTLGIETVNLYSAFVALAVELGAPGGQIVAIIPRSFCNGPYYKAFRDFVFARANLRHIHLFDSRNKAFEEDGVLQENVIILLECGIKQQSVTVTTSTDGTFADLASNAYPFDSIVLPDDAEHFIHIPTSNADNAIELSPAIDYSLNDIGVQVSTGPVVDFRSLDDLCKMPVAGSVPLLYPAHFVRTETKWPILNFKKANAILHNVNTDRLLYPSGFYCVVNRFSPKENKHRVVANVVQPNSFGGASMLGFENHLNVYHYKKGGLPEALARGLSVYLSTTAVDVNFRRSSGHTQVNATDLRVMKYPSRKALISLGRWAMLHGEITQVAIDEQFERLTAAL